MSYYSLGQQTLDFDGVKITLKCVDVLAPSDAVGFVDEGNDVTGIKIWAGATLLCHFIKQNKDLFKEKSLIELGAGTGLPSLFASHYCGSPLFITDGNDEVLDVLNQNVALNIPEKDRLQTMKLYWDNQTDMDAALKTTNNKGFDIILGADIIYTQEAVLPLLNTVDKMLAPNGIFVLVYISRFSRLDEYLLKEATAKFPFFTRKMINQKIEDADAFLCIGAKHQVPESITNLTIQ
jgi:predicted nicotinamide N-methyase